MSQLSVYKKNIEVIRIPMDQVLLLAEDVDLQKVKEGKGFPLLCCFADDKKVGVATEFIKDEGIFLVDISLSKIFSCKSFKREELPNKIGMPIYVTSKGVLTGKKESNFEVGLYKGLENGVVLFMLK